ncbi:MAG: phosphoribosylglycinamide formyltransferase 1 [Parcubacteria bacterium C7867-001]|nr:MAG: phosphoribosylglycinamide formyltransferase 1 [Parcubacteria bacterium C7867-001]
MKPRLLVFASGSLTGGGSGFENLVEHAAKGALKADIVGVVSNHANGGVRERAERLHVPFSHFYDMSWSAEGYWKLVEEYKPDFVALSGWLKPVRGLNPRTTFNIHPAPLPAFGGKGLYGQYVHEAVLVAFREGRVSVSAVTMHFVTPEYDRGPVFFEHAVRIDPDDTPETLGKRVKDAEHFWQPRITNLVVQGHIRWDGENEVSLTGEMAI